MVRDTQYGSCIRHFETIPMKPFGMIGTTLLLSRMCYSVERDKCPWELYQKFSFLRRTFEVVSWSKSENVTAFINGRKHVRKKLLKFQVIIKSSTRLVLKEECFIRYRNSNKCVEKTRRSRVFQPTSKYLDI